MRVLETRITVLTFFLITNLIGAFFFFQWEMDWGAALFGDRSSVPMIVLSFGPVVQLAVLWMVWRYLCEVPAKDRLFPRLIVGDLETERLNHSWEKGSALTVLGLPIIAFTWAWERFLNEGTVFDKATGIEVGRFDFVSPRLMLGGWDIYRYGDVLSGEASSFVPFWQPLLIMGGGTLAVMVLSARILLQLRERAHVRRRMVRRPT